MRQNLQQRFASGTRRKFRNSEIIMLNRNLILLTTLFVAALIGCKKKEAGSPGAIPSVPVSDAASAQPGAAPASAAPLPAPQPAPQFVTANAQNDPARGVVGDVDPFLTQQLQIFVQQKRRMPQTFAELADTRLDSVPSPPAGTKWVIDAASRQVKAVKTQ